jgi:hypothetical protein
MSKRSFRPDVEAFERRITPGDLPATGIPTVYETGPVAVPSNIPDDDPILRLSPTEQFLVKIDNNVIVPVTDTLVNSFWFGYGVVEAYANTAIDALIAVPPISGPIIIVP